jgi:hypothetical protein
MSLYFPRDLIKKAKEEVKVIYYADLLCGPCGLRRLETQEGIRWIGRCPIRPHDPRMRTFQVDPEADSWKCSECRRGGDVIDFVMAANRCDNEQIAAATLLSISFLRGD